MLFSADKRSLFKSSQSLATDNLLPWINDSQKFVANCTQCGECVAACPEEIVVKGDGGYPSIDFNIGECTFCGKCADSCQEPIFISTEGSPWNKKAVITNQCLAFSDIYCRSCAESCDTQALTFQPGLSSAPQIDVNLCNGCGACVAPCPAMAISIRSMDDE